MQPLQFDEVVTGRPACGGVRANGVQLRAVVVIVLRPEEDQVFSLDRAALTDETMETVVAHFAGRNFSDFKPALAERAATTLGRIGGEMRRMLADPGYIDGVLRRGAERASAIAFPVLRQAQEISGLLRP